jgi:hypothetical protein
MRAANLKTLAIALTLMGPVALAQQLADSSTPINKAASGAATITYDFVRPGLSVPRFTILLHEDGTGTYKAEEAERKSADAVVQQVSMKQIDRPISLSPEMTAKIFSTARSLNHFDMFCGTKAKNIADTGKKTLTYTAPDGTGSCTYNYSDDKSVTMLTNQFYAIAYTMDVGRRLDFERRFDRLGLDAEMLSLEHAVQEKNALELGNIAPTLQRIADDGEAMQRVRQRAAKLLLENAVSNK